MNGRGGRSRGRTGATFSLIVGDSARMVAGVVVVEVHRVPMAVVVIVAAAVDVIVVCIGVVMV